MDAAVKRIAPQTQCYQRRRPEKTLWYRTVQTHFETWLALSGGQGDESTPAYIEQAFRRYLDCGILAKGFARAHCDECGHDFLIAFSCKGRGVCPSCNTRRMAETAAHLTDHVFPRLPVRQWVISVPKRLRYFLQRDTALQGAVLRILLRVVERCLREHSPGCDRTARIGAVAFIHRFGSSLNEHVHFHCCIVDGVFESAGIGDIDDTSDVADEVADVDFHAATGLNAAAIAQVQAQVRQRTLRAFVRRGLIDKRDSDVGGCVNVPKSGGKRPSLHGRKRETAALTTMRYCISPTPRQGCGSPGCIRPQPALDLATVRFFIPHPKHLSCPGKTLRQIYAVLDRRSHHPLDAEHLVYHNPKPRSDSPRELVLTPLELIDKIATLIPPPRAHRHRYYGVLAPNSPLRAAVTALAPMPVIVPLPVEAGAADAAPRRAASHYLWAMLLARIYETLPLVCPLCQSPMRIIAFITDGSTVRKILDHLGESTLPPIVAPAREPPLWEAAMVSEQAGNDPEWDMSAQLVPEFEISASFDDESFCHLGWACAPGLAYVVFWR